MACNYPVRIWQAGDGGPISFTPRRGYDREVFIPCRQCMACRITRKREWKLRIIHESKLHKQNCWITLTYAPEHLPPGGSLQYRDVQLFFKRLRRKVGPFRFFVCGEYGDQLSRPHYHAILFGLWFEDSRRRSLLADPSARVSWSSRTLTDLWGLGHTQIDALTPAAAEYVSGYVLKKVTGHAAEDHYGGRAPEFARMSLRPGIGARFFDQFHSDFYNSVDGESFCVVDGRPLPVPQYYDNRLKALDPDLHNRVKEQRELSAVQHRENTLPARLEARDLIQRAKARDTKRSYENDSPSRFRP